ncbi:MAG: hypothetical protein NZO58_12445, partial [Gemmataceae bacterium]|nr:hypothetical protein [Gemmataceae bacterium]
IAAVAEAIRARDTALAPIKKAQDDLYDAMDRYADNHLFYRAELQRLRQGTGPQEVKEIKFVNGAQVLTTPAPKRTGRPAFEDKKLDDIDKSLAQYEEILGLAELKELKGKSIKDLTEAELEAALVKRRMVAKGLDKEIADLTEELRDWTRKEKEITKLLGGVDDAGNKVRIGLLDLLEMEAQTQARIQFEKSYLQPQWAEAVEEAEKLIQRRQQLQQTLDRLEKDLGISSPK